MRSFKNKTIKSIVALSLLGLVIAAPRETVGIKVQEYILNGQFYSTSSIYGVIRGSMEYNSDERNNSCLVLFFVL